MLCYERFFRRVLRKLKSGCCLTFFELRLGWEDALQVVFHDFDSLTRVKHVTVGQLGTILHVGEWLFVFVPPPQVAFDFRRICRDAEPF